MSRKNEKSSAAEVSTEREGSSQRWVVKGSEVSTVRGSVDNEDTERRRSDKQEDSGFNRFHGDGEATRDRAIAIERMRQETKSEFI